VAALGADPADDDLHMVRIRAKRLRYACEAFVPILGKPAARLAKAAAGLQGVLGDLHDAIVAEQWIRNAVAGGTAEQGVAAGLLVGLDRAEAADRRAEWPAAWAALGDKRLRAWMRG
jgi:CHAD domain-containing protein